MLQKQLIPIDYTSGYVFMINAEDLPSGSPELRNITICRNELRRVAGFQVETATGYTPPNEDILAATPYFIDEVFQYLLAVTPDHILKRQDYAWSTLADYVTVAYRQISFVKWLNTVWIVSRDNPPGYWDGTNFVTPTDYTGVYASCACAFYSAILFGDVTEATIRSRTRLQWTQIGDPTVLYGSSSGFVDLVDTPGAIVNIVPLMDRALVYKEDSIWEVVYTGSPVYYKVYPIALDLGCAAAGSVVLRETTQLFLGDDNVYEIGYSSTSGYQQNPIGRAIQKLLFGSMAIVDDTNRRYSKGIYINERNEYWLACPSVGSDKLDLIFIYQYDTKTWWLKQYDYVYCFSKWTRNTNLRWVDILEQWRQTLLSWDTSTLRSGSSEVLVGVDNDLLRLDYGSAMDGASYPEAYWESKDFTVGWSTRVLALSAEVSGVVGVTASYSTDEGNTWTSMGVKPGGDGQFIQAKWTCNFTAETFRFKITWGNADVRVRRLVAYAVPRRGER